MEGGDVMPIPTLSPPLSVEDAVDLADPSSSIWQPLEGRTHCNQWTRQVARLMGATLPDVLANEQIDYLRSPAAVRDGWAEVSEPVARQWAEAGHLAVAAFYNPTGVHGHIAPLVKGPPGETYVANAGAHNFRRGPIAKAFGFLARSFFTHHPQRACLAPPFPPST